MRDIKAEPLPLSPSVWYKNRRLDFDPQSTPSAIRTHLLPLMDSDCWERETIEATVMFDLLWPAVRSVLELPDDIALTPFRQVLSGITFRHPQLLRRLYVPAYLLAFSWAARRQLAVPKPTVAAVFTAWLARLEDASLTIDEATTESLPSDLGISDCPAAVEPYFLS